MNFFLNIIYSSYLDSLTLTFMFAMSDNDRTVCARVLSRTESVIYSARPPSNCRVDRRSLSFRKIGSRRLSPAIIFRPLRARPPHAHSWQLFFSLSQEDDEDDEEDDEDEKDLDH